MEKKSEHILIIDSLRGIAAIAVCFYHFVYTTQDFIDNELIRSVFYQGKRGVQLFFIISGIVIPLAMINDNYALKKWGNFILKRIIRLEPTYLVALAIGIFYLFIRNYATGTTSIDLTPSFSTILLHLGYLIPFFEDVNWVNPVFWSLAVELQYYIALSLLFPLVLSGKTSYRILFYAILMGIAFIDMPNTFFPFWSPLFLAGIIYALLRKSIIGKIEFWILGLLIAPLIYFLNGGINLAIAISTILLIHFVANFKTILTLFLGKISYSLYLIHSIIGGAVVNYCSHYLQAPYQKFLLVMLGILLSVGSAYLLYRFVEKPTHNYSQKRN